MLNNIPYDVIKFLGWTTAFLLVLAVTFHLTLRLNKALAKKKSDNSTIKKIQGILRKIMPIVRKIHAPVGIIALITGIAHGYLMLRGFMIHPGYITWFFILLLGISGMTMKLFKKKPLYKPVRKVHTVFMYCAVLTAIFHIFL